MQEVAAYFGVHLQTVRSLTANGHLRAYRIGSRTIRFRRDEVEAAAQPIDGDIDAEIKRVVSSTDSPRRSEIGR